MVTMRIILLVSFFAIAVGCVSQHTMRTNDILSVKQIEGEIYNVGEHSYLREIYTDKPKWKMLLSNISKATPEWLAIAARLHHFSDAGSSEQLRLAVGEGIGVNPVNIFEFIDRNAEFSLNNICSAIDVDDVRFDGVNLALSEIDKRRAMLSSLQDPKYHAKKEECLQMLEKAKEPIREFYKQ